MKIYTALAFYTLLSLTGCAGVSPSGEVTGGLPGVASATLLLSKDSTPAEIRAAHDEDLKTCLERQTALTEGNICLCAVFHPDRSYILSLDGFDHCIAKPAAEVNEADLICPEPPEPVQCPDAPICADCPAPVKAIPLPPVPPLGSTALPDLCTEDPDNPYCQALTMRMAAEHLLDLQKTRLDALKGCSRMVGKDTGEFAPGMTPFNCNESATAILDGLTDG